MNIPTVAPPPRRVPPGLWLKLLLGGPFNLFGWLFGGFGLVFMWIFAANSTAVDWITFTGEKDNIRGTVTSYDTTRMRENDAAIYKVNFRYQYDGRSYTAASYTLNETFTAGEAVRVQVLRRNPQAACIVGLRRHPFGVRSLTEFIFPLIGFGIVAFAIRKQLAIIHAARHYHFAKATVSSKTIIPGTNQDEDNKPLWKIGLDYANAYGAPCRSALKTRAPDSYQVGETVAVLYDAQQPKTFIEVPPAIRFDANGEIAEASPLRAVLVPVLAIGVNAVVAWLVLR
jgi:hypothetical protein